jgi:hypothetical protein
MNVTVAAFAGALCLAGCAASHPSRPAPAAANTNPTATVSGPTAVSSPSPVVKRFSGIPMPPNNALDLDRTVVVGAETEWVGRIFFTTPMTPDEVVDFYRREMPRYGWAELAATRSTTSVLSYQADARIATIQMTGLGAASTGQGRAQPSSGTRVEFWMNPRPGGGAPTVLQTVEPGAPPAAPAPLRGVGQTYAIAPAARLPVDQAPLPPWR